MCKNMNELHNCKTDVYHGGCPFSQWDGGYYLGFKESMAAKECRDYEKTTKESGK